MTRLAALLALGLLAACSSRGEHQPYLTSSNDYSIAEGVERRFSICYNPLTQEDWRAAVDRLVFQQCGAYVEPKTERAAGCTLLNPTQRSYTCMLPRE